MSLKIFSGNCCMCDTGIPTGEKDIHGRELFTGDVVQLWHVNCEGTEFEQMLPEDGLTAIVAEQYSSFQGKAPEVINENPTPFTMGIKAIGVQGGKWRVSLVKSHKHVVVGEHFPQFGFNYKF